MLDCTDVYFLFSVVTCKDLLVTLCVCVCVVPNDKGFATPTLPKPRRRQVLEPVHHLRLKHHRERHALHLHAGVEARRQALHDLARKRRVDEGGLELHPVPARQVAYVGDVIAHALEEVVVLVVDANLLDAPAEELDVELGTLALLGRVDHEGSGGVAVALYKGAEDLDEVHVIALAELDGEAAVYHGYADGIAPHRPVAVDDHVSLIHLFIFVPADDGDRGTKI